MKLPLRFARPTVGLLALVGVSTASLADTVIVYDASNSMWGQIDGEAKVTIARRVLGELVTDWDPSEPLGLVAYGHRREGDCSDIETVVAVPPDALDREALLARIEEISPKGKTPLTAALQHAAEELKYRDAPADVILISDGIETCNADPCAVAAELEQAGINFTAHVIGFDVGESDRAQLACIAENTGGRFFAAADAAGLQSALAEATEIATEEIPEPEITLAAPASAVAGSMVEVSWQGENIQPRDFVTIVPVGSEPDAWGRYQRVQQGDAAEVLSPGETGAFEVRYVSSETGRSVAEVAIELTEPEVELSTPESVAGGARFTVEWRNGVHPRDYVTIVPADAPPEASGSYVYIGSESSGELEAPAETGAYEIRYLLSASDTSIASAPIEVVEKAVTVTAPESVTAGTAFEVEWSDVVHPRDYVTVVEAGAPQDAYTDYVYVGEQRSGSLPAPGEPGAYEVRYVLNENRLAVASTALEVGVAETSISAPASAQAGGTVDVSWTRAIHPRDYVTIVPVGAAPDAYGDYERVGGRLEASLAVPADAGDYEVRYILQKSSQSIASAPLTVTGAETEIAAPQAAMAGGLVTVSWTTAIHPRDYVTIVAAGASADAYGDYERVGSRNEASLQVPAQAGSYEVRYILQQSGEFIASSPLQASAPETSVTAPETASPGSRIDVSWTTAIHPRDYVTIVPADAAADVYDGYQYVGSRTAGTLTVPDAPGDYEVRYLLAADGTAIASTPLRVE